jgi:hypothetical protein
MTKLTRKLKAAGRSRASHLAANPCRIRLTAILLAFFFVASSLTANAYCILPEVAESFDRAGAVFVGEVVEITPPRSNWAEAPLFERNHLVEFQIEKSWKGMPFGYLKVWIRLQGYESTLTSISKGERYLVYADPVFENDVATNELMVNMCNRTTLLPKDAEMPRSTLFEFGRKNGARDLRVLDSLLVLKRR